MFEKILVANRGEIACRVMRTARRLGVRTVAVYSDADARALHVAMADEAYRIGPAPARESYLDAAAILDAARRSGARAIHPGYGFLSENADFAEACAAAGLTFIGPSAAAIRAMGSKSAAKKIMGEAGVPLVPGYHGDDQRPETLAAQAERIGYPVLVKATAGGGGKGMRAVAGPGELEAALAGARREALAAFGDDRVLLERYLAKPRHVEIQVFGDTLGAVVHLFERDCSIQRRHQKVLEEAPAPGLGAGLRERMGRAAVTAARAIGYVGAGTVEFLLDEDGQFYFMEMNTRLQVEHPVTELVTAQDLVEWQLRVAAGEPLPCTQEDLVTAGHAIEARVYAEDPARDFLPATGTLTHLRAPAENAHVRVETGVRQGDVVSVHYDPMIAKLVVWDVDRPAALRRLRAALAEYQIVGVATNLAFLSAVAAHPAYAAADLDTRFVERHRAGLVAEAAPVPDTVLALAALDVLLARSEEAAAAARESHDPHSPWHRTDGWRLNADAHHVLTFDDGERRARVVAHYRPGGHLLELPGGTILARAERDPAGDLLADLGGARTRATVVRGGDAITILTPGHAHRLGLFDPGAAAADRDADAGRLTAPMPGKIVAVMVEPGAEVKKGAPLVVLEAMKMEHTITSPRDGKVAELHYGVGAIVEEGAQLLALEVHEA
ncbi:acetyl-CoA carboxylase biotin carboxylase subunit [Anaeromyxobacter sp. SG64]|uniref:acetyl/propionyl/methylcrotonyl-CoA carboxylase subunit alpha n=1 Tax=Anaeromyxobacter sp. SG64 TaxID=2925409 RepID=UPI001F588A53|nr:acetyl-CoA carboxylase biotin carboxylase subunit [Anaeromyxobacter sp. SG64]